MSKSSTLNVHKNIQGGEHTQDTDKDCDPCTWQPHPPVRVDAPRKTTPKFSSKLKYSHELQLEAPGQDGLSD